jgi:hypothetical protein
MSASWKNSATFTSLKDMMTQRKYYTSNNCTPEVYHLVELDSKPFGTVVEKIICEIFGMGPRTSSENDGVFKDKKFEIKSARYWAGEDDCVWQHLEPDHDYEYVLFVLLDFSGFKIFGIKKSTLMGEELCNVTREKKSKKPVNFQGKQGWWTRKSAILPHLTPINSVDDLEKFVSQ